MTDAQHAEAIRDAAKVFIRAIDKARLAGLEVKIEGLNFDDVCGSGKDRGIRYFDSKVVVKRQL